MDSPELVSVVITTYNRSDALLAVLDGFAHQTDRNFEVIVADDGSRESHRRAIVESKVAKDLRVVYVWRPDMGFTLNRNRNCGVAASSGKYLVFLDGDCVPEVDFIAQHKRLAQSGYFVNGSRVLLSQDLTQRVVAGGEKIIGRSWFYWLMQRCLGHANKLTGLLRLPDWSGRVKKAFLWKGIRGCNLAVFRADFERVNGFDESFVGWGHDDADFVVRLHHSGVARKNGFCATEVFHLWHQEATRDTESQNAAVVRAREKSGVTQPTSGYAQSSFKDEAVITRLG